MSKNIYRTIDKNWLEDQYVVHDRTVPEIAKLYGCCLQVIHFALRYHGINIRKARVRDAKILENYLKADRFHNVHRLKGAMIKLFGKQCMLPNCSYETFVDVHHLRGKGYRTKSGRCHTNNRITESVLLCPNHHREADNKLIPIETLEEVIKTRKLKT